MVGRIASREHAPAAQFASRQYPNGLANSSGVLGHYLFDQFYVKNCVKCSGAGGARRQSAAEPDGRRRLHPAVPQSGDARKEFPSRLCLRFLAAAARLTPKYFPLYGDALSRELADVSNAGFSMTTMGDVLPRYENHVRINPDVKDEWGIPALHIHSGTPTTNTRWQRTP